MEEGVVEETEMVDAEAEQKQQLKEIEKLMNQDYVTPYDARDHLREVRTITCSEVLLCKNYMMSSQTRHAACLFASNNQTAPWFKNVPYPWGKFIYCIVTPGL